MLYQGLPAFDQQFRWLGGNDRVGGNRFENQCHCTYLAAFPNGDRSQNSCPHTDSDIVLDSGMTLLVASRSRTPPAGRAECYLMVEHDIIANDGGFTDDHARAVIDEEAFSNLCPRVDLDATGHETGEL